MRTQIESLDNLPPFLHFRQFHINRPTRMTLKHHIHSHRASSSWTPNRTRAACTLCHWSRSSLPSQWFWLWASWRRAALRRTGQHDTIVEWTSWSTECTTHRDNNNKHQLPKAMHIFITISSSQQAPNYTHNIVSLKPNF